MTTSTFNSRYGNFNIVDDLSGTISANGPDNFILTFYYPAGNTVYQAQCFNSAMNAIGVKIQDLCEQQKDELRNLQRAQTIVTLRKTNQLPDVLHEMQNPTALPLSIIPPPVVIDPPPTDFPVAGTVLGHHCSGFNYMVDKADGLGGTVTTIEEVNSASCGFVGGGGNVLSMTELNVTAGLDYQIYTQPFGSPTLCQAPDQIISWSIVSGNLPAGMTLVPGPNADSVLLYLVGIADDTAGTFDGVISVTTATSGNLLGDFRINLTAAQLHGIAVFSTVGNHEFACPLGVTEFTVTLTGADGGGGVGVQYGPDFFPGEDGWAGETETFIITFPLENVHHTIGFNIGGAAPGVTNALYQTGNGPAGASYWGNAAQGSNGGAGAGGYSHINILNQGEHQIPGGHGGKGGWNGFMTGTGGDGSILIHTGGKGGTIDSPDGKTGNDGSCTITW